VSDHDGAALTLAQLSAGQEPPYAGPSLRPDIRRANEAASRHLVVLDDDPTGSQAVHDVPVLTTWSDDDLRWAFRQPGSTVFILTNTRSLGSSETRDLLVDLAGRIDAIATELGTEAVLISRSDSTLRGHFPLETDVLMQAARSHGHAYDALLLVPAYLDAGRVTVEDVHYARTADAYVPVGRTQYAADDAFGYRSSDLRDWVREKTGDLDVPVLSISLADIRKGGAPLVTSRLLEARDGAVVVVNALEDSDLDVVALAMTQAEASGWRALCRVGPSFVAARAGLDRRTPLRAREIFRTARPAAHGLVVVGSHVDLTSRQVALLQELPAIETVELDVTLLHSAESATQETERCFVALTSAASGSDLLLMTSRTRTVLGSGEATLEFARTVSAALVDLTRRIVGSVDLAWVVAKGGITSHDVATGGLGMRRAVVLGQLFEGIVSVWRNEPVPGETRTAGLPYVVFAGNVGDDTALRDAVAILRGEPDA